MLSNYKKQILEGLNSFEPLISLIDKKFSATGSYYPIIFYCFLNHLLSKEQLENILPILSNLPKVRGKDLRKAEQEEYFKNLKELTHT